MYIKYIKNVIKTDVLKNFGQFIHHSQSKAKYFVQSEVDILTKPGNMTIIKEYDSLLECISFRPIPRYMIKFCKIGCLEKLVTKKSIKPGYANDHRFSNMLEMFHH